MSFKRSRTSRSDSFDQPHYPNNSKNSSTNPNKFLKPSLIQNSDQSQANNKVFNLTSPPENSVGMTSGGQSNVGELLKECFFCKKKIQSDDTIFMYRSLAFCKEECRAIQMSFDEELMKRKQLMLSNKNVAHQASP